MALKNFMANAALGKRGFGQVRLRGCELAQNETFSIGALPKLRQINAPARDPTVSKGAFRCTVTGKSPRRNPTVCAIDSVVGSTGLPRNWSRSFPRRDP